MISCASLWKNFLRELNEFKDKEVSKIDFFNFIVKWLRDNKKGFQKREWESYKLDNYLNYDPSIYKIESSELDIGDCINSWNLTTPSSKITIAMFLRDALWDLIVFKIELECINCGDFCAEIMFDDEEEIIVLSCVQCDYSQDKKGEKWSKHYHLVPANKLQLELHGYALNR